MTDDAAVSESADAGTSQMPESTNTPGASAEKVFSGVMAVIALAAVGVALWRGTQKDAEIVETSQSSSLKLLKEVTNQRLDTLDGQYDKLLHHNDQPAHAVAVEWNKALADKLADIKDQMHEDDVRELSDAGEFERFNEQLREIETQFRNMDRFIQLLWQRVYEEPLPNPPARREN